MNDWRSRQYLNPGAALGCSLAAAVLSRASLTQPLSVCTIIQSIMEKSRTELSNIPVRIVNTILTELVRSASPGPLCCIMSDILRYAVSSIQSGDEWLASALQLVGEVLNYHFMTPQQEKIWLSLRTIQPQITGNDRVLGVRFERIKDYETSPIERQLQETALQLGVHSVLIQLYRRLDCAISQQSPGDDSIQALHFTVRSVLASLVETICPENVSAPLRDPWYCSIAQFVCYLVTSRGALAVDAASMAAHILTATDVLSYSDQLPPDLCGSLRLSACEVLCPRDPAIWFSGVTIQERTALLYSVIHYLPGLREDTGSRSAALFRGLVDYILALGRAPQLFDSVTDRESLKEFVHSLGCLGRQDLENSVSYCSGILASYTESGPFALALLVALDLCSDSADSGLTPISATLLVEAHGPTDSLASRPAINLLLSLEKSALLGTRAPDLARSLSAMRIADIAVDSMANLLACTPECAPKSSLRRSFIVFSLSLLHCGDPAGYEAVSLAAMIQADSGTCLPLSPEATELFRILCDLISSRQLLMGFSPTQRRRICDSLARTFTWSQLNPSSFLSLCLCASRIVLEYSQNTSDLTAILANALTVATTQPPSDPHLLVMLIGDAVIVADYLCNQSPGMDSTSAVALCQQIARFADWAVALLEHMALASPSDSIDFPDFVASIRRDELSLFHSTAPALLMGQKGKPYGDDQAQFIMCCTSVFSSLDTRSDAFANESVGFLACQLVDDIFPALGHQELAALRNTTVPACLALISAGIASRSTHLVSQARCTLLVIMRQLIVWCPHTALQCFRDYFRLVLTGGVAADDCWGTFEQFEPLFTNTQMKPEALQVIHEDLQSTLGVGLRAVVEITRLFTSEISSDSPASRCNLGQCLSALANLISDITASS